MRRAKIEVFEGADKLWYFHLRNFNGEVQCVSEGYTRRGSAIRGAHAAQRAWIKAMIVVVED